jgi:hypothetical protein
MSNLEKLVEVFEITEWREGAVFKTRSLGLRWVDFDEKYRSPEGFIYASVSTEWIDEHPDEMTIRRKKRTDE